MNCDCGAEMEVLYGNAFSCRRCKTLVMPEAFNPLKSLRGELSTEVGLSDESIRRILDTFIIPRNGWVSSLITVKDLDMDFCKECGCTLEADTSCAVCAGSVEVEPDFAATLIGEAMSRLTTVRSAIDRLRNETIDISSRLQKVDYELRQRKEKS